MLWVAAEEGLIANGSSIHVGIRTPLLDIADYENDQTAGFAIIEAEEMEDIGYKGIVNRIRAAVGDLPVYRTSIRSSARDTEVAERFDEVSIDIDVIGKAMVVDCRKLL